MRALAALFLLLFGLISSHAGAAQEWPTRLVKIVLPGSPGGAPDRVTRIIAERLSKMWDVPVIVENKAGGTTRIGAEAVATAAPDGYTLLSTFNTHATLKLLFPDTKFDPISSFEPVIQLVNTGIVLSVNAESPYRSLPELLDAFRKRGEPLPYAHFGIGSGFHLYGLTLGRQAGIEVLPIAYKGESLQMNDLLGKHVESSFNAVGTALPLVRAGSIRALALVAPARSSLLLDVPTFAELGFSGLETGGWFGLLAPAGTPKPVIEKIHSDVTKILADPEVAKSLTEQGLEIAVTSAAAFGVKLKAEESRARTLFHDFNLKPE
ncbi:MAG TPA: tripartite tricarboxylate transporter substrate binding protein [Sphingomicrobium sp.]|nr:tripartite tricarboxylate transporter substrate binding protein [Sphingomicrobium sp.]